MLLHSRQKRKLICSCLVGASVAEAVEGAGEAIVSLVLWRNYVLRILVAYKMLLGVSAPV